MKKFSIIILLLMPVLSFASEKPVWTEADGEAYMSEIDTPKEVMARAKANLKEGDFEGYVSS
jgi:hypothetical protein